LALARLSLSHSSESPSLPLKNPDPKPSAIDLAVGGKVDGSDPRPDPGPKGKRKIEQVFPKAGYPLLEEFRKHRSFWHNLLFFNIVQLLEKPVFLVKQKLFFFLIL